MRWLELVQTCPNAEPKQLTKALRSSNRAVAIKPSDTWMRPLKDEGIGINPRKLVVFPVPCLKRHKENGGPTVWLLLENSGLCEVASPTPQMA